MRLLTCVLGLSVVSAGLFSVTSFAGSTSDDESQDKMLALAIRSPQSFMFAEQAMSQAVAPGQELVITSALGVRKTPETVRILPGTMRVFRADAQHDDFTQQGGWYWRCGNEEGKLQFEKPGALIMVVRQKDGTVHWYSLTPDFRC